MEGGGQGPALLVAVAAERVMAPASDADKAAKARSLQRVKRQRAKLVNFARDIARSGRHADHRGVIRELEAMQDVLDGLPAARARLEDPAFRTQLDRLCHMARAVDFPGSDESNG